MTTALNSLLHLGKAVATQVPFLLIVKALLCNGLEGCSVLISPDWPSIALQHPPPRPLPTVSFTTLHHPPLVPPLTVSLITLHHSPQGLPLIVSFITLHHPPLGPPLTVSPNILDHPPLGPSLRVPFITSPGIMYYRGHHWERLLPVFIIHHWGFVKIPNPHYKCHGPSDDQTANVPQHTQGIEGMKNLCPYSGKYIPPGIRVYSMFLSVALSSISVSTQQQITTRTYNLVHFPSNKHAIIWTKDCSLLHICDEKEKHGKWK